MVTPLDTLAPFSPINPVTPFTYRDNATTLTVLRLLENKLNSVIEALNDSNIEITDNLNEAITELTNSLNLQIAALYNELVERIDSSHDDSVADDPTTGRRNEGLSKVVANVYDNARIFAYFASQYDALELTCAEYEALNYSARFFDLAPLYPVLNATNPTGN